jgi:hypothetical protein
MKRDKILAFLEDHGETADRIKAMSYRGACITAATIAAGSIHRKAAFCQSMTDAARESLALKLIELDEATDTTETKGAK